MMPLGQLWKNAQDVTQSALKRADADVLGTERARVQYEAMTPAARSAMEEEVIRRYGRTAWDDFLGAVGGQDARITKT